MLVFKCRNRLFSLRIDEISFIFRWLSIRGISLRVNTIWVSPGLFNIYFWFTVALIKFHSDLFHSSLVSSHKSAGSKPKHQCYAIFGWCAEFFKCRATQAHIIVFSYARDFCIAMFIIPIKPTGYRKPWNNYESLLKNYHVQNRQKK